MDFILLQAGAQISLYQDGDMLTMEFLDYRLKIPDEMWRQVKRDIYREIEDFSGERQRICWERLRRFIMNAIEFGQKRAYRKSADNASVGTGKVFP